MCMIKTPDAPPIPELPPLPELTTSTGEKEQKQIYNAKRDEKNRRSKQMGREKTVLTGDVPDAKVSKPTLLGG